MFGARARACVCVCVWFNSWRCQCLKDELEKIWKKRLVNGLDDPGFESRQEQEILLFSPPNRPDRLWGHPTFYSMGTGVLSSTGGGGKRGSTGHVRFTTHLHPAPRLITSRAILYATYLAFMARTGANLPSEGSGCGLMEILSQQLSERPE
jgi:hypothetical protein